MMNTFFATHSPLAACVPALALMLGACAAGPERESLATIGMAEAGISQAEKSGAPEYSPLELTLAREKIERARKLAEDEEYDQALRLAEQAQVDAELSAATARAAQNMQAAEQLQKSVETLRAEATRTDSTTEDHQ